MFALINPKTIFTTLDAIDDEAPSYSLNRRQSTRRVFYVMACVAVSLLMIHYLKYFTAFNGLMTMLSTQLGESPLYLRLLLQESGFLELTSYAWWTLWHVIGYVALPYLVIRWKFKSSMLDMGWRWEATSQHWKGYVLLITPILFFIFLVSFRGDFLNHYPFYKMAHRSWLDLICWEALYLLQFVCLEFFFRGFMINALRPAVGANAIWIMCVPYMMIHLPKLWLEATGAILFGLFLGLLALRSRSIWGGFLVHAGVAITMDVASLLRQGKMPTSFLPF